MASGDDLVAGEINESGRETILSGIGSNWIVGDFQGDNVLQVSSPLNSRRIVNGIHGSSNRGSGVVGNGQTGVEGHGQNGVVGFSEVPSNDPSNPNAGVVGHGEIGVIGINEVPSNDPNNPNAGVVGRGEIGVAGNGGDVGVSATGDVYGVKAVSDSFIGVLAAGHIMGVEAVGGEKGVYAAGGPTGVHGLGAEVGVFGEIGENGDQVKGIGIKGIGGTGVEGIGDTGVHGFGDIGVLGKANGTQIFPGHDGPFIGVKGSAIMGIGVYGESHLGGHAIFCNGAFAATGSKSAIVPHPDGSHRTLYCMESPESWFEDFGTGELEEGRATIYLDQDFVPLIQNDDYHVFLTPEGDSNGLYISHKSSTSFEVREQQNGSNSLRFSYRVVAKRKDVTPPRLEKVKLHDEILNPTIPGNPNLS